jgi:threonine dehydratase
MDGLFEKIVEAHAAIRPDVLVTPLQHSPALSDLYDCRVLLKCDHVQPTGSFKLRGATNKIRLLDASARRAGVITASTGNHGQAVARAGKRAGIDVTVFVSSITVASKIKAIEALGAKVEIVEAAPMEAELKARAAAKEAGKVYIPPYNDLDIVAGQGTLGVELAEQCADLDAVFVATGCGGLTGGTGTALKQLSPKTEIVAVWPENSAALFGALNAGKIIDVPEKPTLSDGTAGALEPGSITFPICQKVIDTTLLVSEPEIAKAMRLVFETDRWAVEGAAGVALAGFMKSARTYRGKTVAVVLCGRNIALDAFEAAVRSVQ